MFLVRFVFFFPLLGGVLLGGVHALDMHDVNLEPFGQEGMTEFRNVTTTMLPTVRGRGLQTGGETCLPTKLLGVDGGSTQAQGVAVADADGSVYITGSNHAGNLDGEMRIEIFPDMPIGTNTTAFLTKYSSSGAKEWTKLLGAVGGRTYVKGVAVADADGSVYITGSFRSNVFLTKYSSTGIKQWTTLLGFDDADETDETFALGVAVSNADGSVYITGFLTNSFNRRAFLTKYSSSGAKQWTKLLGITDESELDESEQLVSASSTGVAVADADGSVYITGWGVVASVLSTEIGDPNALLTKYSSSGAKEWTKLLAINGWFTSALGVAVSGSGDYVYITGVNIGGNAGQTIEGTLSAFLTKYSSSGAEQWTQLQRADDRHIGAFGVAVADADGSVYITGGTDGNLDGETRIGTNTNAFLTKYSSSGAKEWTKLLGVDGEATSAVSVAVADADGSVYITGSTNGNLDGETHIGTVANAFLKHYGGTDPEHCLCAPGFVGSPRDGCRACSIDADCSDNTSSVSSNPAAGTCTCTCNDGFTGDRCETNVDDCIDQTCSGHGSCVDGVNSFTCTCNDGFTGDRCVIAPTDFVSHAVVGVLLLILLGLGFLAFVSWQKQKKGGQQVSDEQGGPTLRRVLTTNNSNISPHMQRLQAKLDAAIATQDFEEAARVKKMMDAFQAQKGRRDELQAKLNAAIAAQDFEEAARVKRMLDAFSAQSPEASVVAVGTAIGQI
jgi:hypothetical protein